MNRFEALRRALEAVYSGEQRLETEAVVDQLDDLGYEIALKKPAHKTLRAV